MRSEYVLEQDLQAMLKVLMPDNRRVIKACLATGLRINDVLSWKTDQLKPQFWVTEQKTGKRKKIQLKKDLLAELQRHAGKVFVWPHRTKPLTHHRTRQAVWRDVKRASKAYRMPQNVTPHSVRKLYATQLLDRYKGDLAKVQKALNHSDATVTMIYAMAREYSRIQHPEMWRDAD